MTNQIRDQKPQATNLITVTEALLGGGGGGGGGMHVPRLNFKSQVMSQFRKVLTSLSEFRPLPRQK